MKKTNQTLDPALTKGLVNHTYTDGSLELDCWLEYEPAEGDGWNEPHTSESMTLVYATVGGIDIASFLGDETVAAIEADSIKGMATAAFDAAFDLAADRAADKAEFDEAYA